MIKINGVEQGAPLQRMYDVSALATAPGGSLIIPVPRGPVAVLVYLAGILSSSNTNLEMQFTLAGNPVGTGTIALVSTSVKRTITLNLTKTPNNSTATGTGALQPASGSGAAVVNVPTTTTSFDGLRFVLQGGASVLSADWARAVALTL